VIGARVRLGLLAVVAVLLLLDDAQAADADRPVLLLHPGGENIARYTDDLVPAVAARLSTMPVAVQGVVVDGPIDEKRARREAEERGAWTVAWLTPAEDSLWLLSPTVGAPAHVRTVDDTGPSWVALCEAVASMLHAELNVLLVAAPPWSPPTEDAVAEEDAASPEGVTDDETTPVDESVAAEPESASNDPSPAATEEDDTEPPRRSPAQFVLRLGYTPIPVTTTGPVLHGLDAGVGFQPVPWIGAEVGISLTNPVPIEGVGTVSRVPIRASAVGTLPLGRFEPSLSLGLLLEVLQVRGLSFLPEDAASIAPLVTPGLAVEGRAAVVPLPWLKPYLSVGIDAHTRSQEVVLHDVVIAQRDAVLLRASVGVAFVLPPGTR
jgi:hypothetical protein